MSSSQKPSARAAPKKRLSKIAPAIPIPSLVPLAALFGPCLKKVRFPDEEADWQGFRVLRHSGYAFEMLRGNIYGVISEKQLKLLNKHKVPYEVVA